MSFKFVIIGAGSTVFTPGLLADLTNSEVFKDATVALVDIDPKAAETMAGIGRKLAEAKGSRITFEHSADRRAVLAGADFVTTTIAVGGAQGWKDDVDIPLAHGIRQTVGDSVGPGGILRALRHIPELVAIAQDVAELAPNAQIINYTNPLTANVRAMRKATGLDVVGLCHGTMYTRKCLARDLGYRWEDVEATFAGVNHLCWLLDLRADGKDLYPALRSAVAEKAVGGYDAVASPDEGVHQVVAADMMNRLGLYPAPGDRHISEFSRWYLEDGTGQTLGWGMQAGLDMTLGFIAEKGDLWEKFTEEAGGSRALPEELLDSAREGERVVSICEAIATGRPIRELAVNTTNRGLIPGLPDDAVVEVPAVVDATGIHGVAVPALPGGITAMLRQRIAIQELTVEAALTADYDLAIGALMADPLVPNPAIAQAILDESLRRHPLEGFGR